MTIVLEKRGDAMSETLAEKLERLLKEKGLSEYRLAELIGKKQSYVTKLMKGMIKNPGLDSLTKIAKALDVSLSELAGEELEVGPGPTKRETPEEILERYRLAAPISVPVYTEFPLHAGAGVEPVNYVYLSRSVAANRNIVAYIIHGDCLEPYVEEGDTVIVDLDLAPENGGLIVCLVNDEVHISRFKLDSRGTYLENKHGTRALEDCQVAQVVIEVIKKTRKNYRWPAD